MAYENLFKPLNIGKLKIKNRIVMTGMATGLANYDGSVSDDYVEFFKARARGGTGLMFTEFCRVDRFGAGGSNQVACYDIALAGGLRRVAEAVHRFDSRIFLQLHHGGRQARSAINGGRQPIAPSACTYPGGEMPREMTVEEIHEMVQKFVVGAQVALFANFDGVEVHCAHGYLLNQFVSSYSNKRTDEYGGSLENRLRIVKEIMEGIKKVCGPAYPISVRISADDLLPDEGMKLEEAQEMAKLLVSYGASIISVSAGGNQAPQGIIAPSLYEEGWLVPLAEGIKKVVDVPVIAVSLIRDFNYADKIIADGKADLVSMARPHLADPSFVKKLQSGHPEQVRPCIVCMHCATSVGRGRMECAVNPTMGYEAELQQFNKNGNGRRVVVIGGGSAGCEAARVLAIRGFNVTLLEKRDRLGGQLNIAKLPPHKFRLGWLVNYYENNLERWGVHVKLNTKANIADIKAMEPYAVVLATGGEAFIPSFVERNNSLTCTANDILLEKIKLEEKQQAVIVGSGMTGMETAHFLLEQGVKVHVVEMLPEIGMASIGPNMGYLKKALAQYENFEATAGVKVLSVNNNVVSLEKVATGEKMEIKTNCTVFAAGVRPVNDLEETIKHEFKNTFVVGDSSKIGQISNAVRAGFATAWHIDDGCDVFDA